MKQFLISYHFSQGSETEWQQEVSRFITTLENDPELKDKVTYRCLKSANGPEYFHLATAIDEQATHLLSQRDFFKQYTQRTEQVSNGTVKVTPLELIAATNTQR